jgi:hypothetical protein
MGKVIARRVVELGSVICVVAGGPTGAIVASDWLPQRFSTCPKKPHLKNGCNFMRLNKNASIDEINSSFALLTLK